MIELRAARKLLLESVHSLSAEKVKLSDSLGRTLAQDLVASRNIPPFPRSPLDGYAFRASDTAGASDENPCLLKVIGTIAAGEVFTGQLKKRETVKVATGSPIPDGANSIVRFEDIHREGDRIKIYSQFSPWENVAPAGEDVKKGTKVVEAGQVLTPPEIGLIASLGVLDVEVVKKPRVAIISTGDELVEPGQKLMPGQIYNSNAYTLMSSIRRLAGQPIFIGITGDSKKKIKRLIKESIEKRKADLIITTGGVSVGERDLVEEILKEVQAKLLFPCLGLKPGTPTTGALLDQVPILGLSGNPAACLTGFHLLGEPLLKKLSGRRELFNPRVEVTLDDGFERVSSLYRYLRAKLYHSGGEIRASLRETQRPGVLSSMIQANGLVVVPPNKGPVEPGERLKAVVLDESSIFTPGREV